MMAGFSRVRCANIREK
uniref:Uncharacterized protein n=1 Tax=Anopheles arabiensis TaxID=7173 RepID=A0A182IGW1_ANOAR